MKSPSTATSWFVVMSAASSLVLMICLFQIDGMVRYTFYNHGLQFSYSWANPYLRLTQVGFAAGWVNIIVAFAVQFNSSRMKHSAEQASAKLEEARADAKMPEDEKGQEESRKELIEAEPTKSPEEASAMTPESEAQEKKEESPQLEQIPEQEPEQPDTESEETPSLVDLFR